MDFKLNRLTEEVKCESVGIPDIPTLKFGNLEDGTLVFNASDYLRQNGKDGDYREFSRGMRFWIEQMAKGYGISTASMFFANPDGTELYHEILVYLFLMYLDPAIMMYFNTMIDDLMTNGIAFSDTFIIELASTRLPDDIVQIKGLNGNSKDSGI